MAQNKVEEENYELCPKCDKRLIFKNNECWCSSKRCDFGKKRLIIKFN